MPCHDASLTPSFSFVPVGVVSGVVGALQVLLSPPTPTSFSAFASPPSQPFNKLCPSRMRSRQLLSSPSDAAGWAVCVVGSGETSALKESGTTEHNTHKTEGIAMGRFRFMSAHAVGILVLVVVMLVTGSVNTLSKVLQFLFIINLPFILIQTDLDYRNGRTSRTAGAFPARTSPSPSPGTLYSF